MKQTRKHPILTMTMAILWERWEIVRFFREHVTEFGEIEPVPFTGELPNPWAVESAISNLRSIACCLGAILFRGVGDYCENGSGLGWVRRAEEYGG